jgi:uncharacterized protein YraI
MRRIVLLALTAASLYTTASEAAPGSFRTLDTYLNVRDGASADYDIVGVIPPGARGVRIDEGCRDEWCHITWRAVSGWVNARFLRRERAGVNLQIWLGSSDHPQPAVACMGNNC